MKVDANQYKAIIDSTPNMIWRANTEKECDYFNATWLRFRGKTMEEEYGYGWLKGVHPEDKVRCLETFQNAFEAREPFSMEYRLERYDGQYRWINDRGTPMFDENNDFLGYVGSCIDIEENIEGRMLKEFSAQEQLNIISEVASGLAHEIRNPLTTVRGFLQMMTEHIMVDTYKDYCELMLNEIDKANSIMTNFLYLDINKAYKLTSCSLNAVIHRAIPILERYAGPKAILISFEEECLPPLLLDEEEVSKLILNLAMNGIEAMESGVLSIKTYVQDNRAVLEIKDQGKGIEHSILNKLGKPFVSTKANKVGIGLAICNSIAHRHNAEITYRTSEAGTTFYICFNRMAYEMGYIHPYTAENNRFGTVKESAS
jgi:PAS domain S-box-containing protein